MPTFHDMRMDDNVYGYGFRVVEGQRPSHAALSDLGRVFQYPQSDRTWIHSKQLRK
jgi:hypothetical protein